MADLADITEILADRPERFIIFCDDLSFEDGESGYKAMKSALDGSVSAQVDNVLIYAHEGKSIVGDELIQLVGVTTAQLHLTEGVLHI